MQKYLTLFIKKGKKLIKNVWVILALSLIAGLLIGAAVSHVYFPKIVEKEKIVEIEKKVYINITDNKKPEVITKTKNVIITKPQLNYPADRPRGEPNKAYVIVKDKETNKLIKKEAGSKYGNEPRECAKLHNRSAC